jgi:two-component system cell cycle sensor histidine kinase/response regulator CckA
MVTAIFHLITNAIDAMPTGGDLVIKTSSRSFASSERTDWRSEGGFVAGDTAIIIEISDTGHGIPVDKLGRIYELFFTTKLAGQGTGLGLSTVQKIIQLHNGTINISNRPEGGVLARLTLKTTAA